MKTQVAVGSPGYIDKVVRSPAGPLLELLIARLQVPKIDIHADTCPGILPSKKRWVLGSLAG